MRHRRRKVDGELVGNAFCGGCQETVQVVSRDGSFSYEYGSERGVYEQWSFECSQCGDAIRQNDITFAEPDFPDREGDY